MSKKMTNLPTLIRVYFDQYGGQDNVEREGIIVADAQSYGVARQAIEDLKSGARAAPLVIVVRSPHFFAGFHDLVDLGGLVKTMHIAPRDELARALCIQIPPILTNQDLIALGIRTPSDVLAFADASDSWDQTAFDDALLCRAFDSEVFRVVDAFAYEEWFKRLLDFLHAPEAAHSIGWTMAYTRNLAWERTQAVLERWGMGVLRSFVTDLYQRCATGRAQAYLDQLATRYWLNSYPKLACKTVIANLTDQVGSWQEVKDETSIMGALSSWCEEQYEQTENPLLEHLEQVLTLLLDRESLIEDQNLDRYIDRVSGRFAAEYEVVQTRLANLLLGPRSPETVEEQGSALQSYTARITERFVPLSKKQGQTVRTANWTAALLEYRGIADHLKEASPSHLTDWVATYELLIQARRLKRSIEDDCADKYADQLTDLNVSLSTLDERLNGSFADWLFGAYPRLLTSGTEQMPLVMATARLALDYLDRGKRVVLLVVDALDWELWQSLRTMFAQEGFVVQGNEVGLAVLPTITEFSRRSVFAGLTPRNLANFVDDIYGTDISPREEARTLARALGYLGRIDEFKFLPDSKRIQCLAHELVYANGSEKDFRRALELDARCYAFVYTELDTLIHGSKLTEADLKETARQWLQNLVLELFKGIRQNTALDETNLEFMITSDHGFLDVSDQDRAEFDKSLRDFIDLERHGRLAIFRTKSGSSQQVADIVQVAKEFYEQHGTKWHAIWREQSEQFGLAESSPSEGEVIAWFMPRLLQYVSKGKGNYVHGGLSMYEAIVPMATLSRGIIDFEPPVITLTGQLSSEEESMLSIAIMNKNETPLRDVVVVIPELGIDGLRFGEIRRNDVRSVSTPVVPPRSGDILVQVTVEGEIGRARPRFSEQRVITVQPGRRERIRLSTRRTFEEDNW